MLEAGEHDIAFAQGQFAVAGTDRRIGLFEVAAAAQTRADLPEDLRGPLKAACDETVRQGAFPFGSHVCEVEVDPDTGAVEVASYVAVDDVGRAVNPLILHGQSHGGIAQGVGQALLEQCVYEAAGGQLLTSSFMDYAMPRADTLPSLVTAISEVPSPTNRLGIRGGGEGGTTPALAVVVNAIVDALADYGVQHLEMPVTSERDLARHRCRTAPGGATIGFSPRFTTTRGGAPSPAGARSERPPACRRRATGGTLPHRRAARAYCPTRRPGARAAVCAGG